MDIKETPLRDLLILQPRVHGDERGFFVESWNQKTFQEMGLDLAFVQDNHSRSGRGTLRGLHYQLEPGQTVPVASQLFSAAALLSLESINGEPEGKSYRYVSISVSKKPYGPNQWRRFRQSFSTASSIHKYSQSRSTSRQEFTRIAISNAKSRTKWLHIFRSRSTSVVPYF